MSSLSRSAVQTSRGWLKVVVELFGFRIFCAELYVWIDRSATVSNVDSFLPAAASLRWRSPATIALRLEAELFLLLDSKYVPVPFDFEEGVGLGAFVVEGMLPNVADIGILGGGIESCLTGSVFSGRLLPFLDALRFHERLNFRLMEVPIDDGVGGSSGSAGGGGDFAVEDLAAAGFGARGPEGFWIGTDAS